MTYVLFKAVHVLGVVLLVGNVTVTAVWKVFADRTRNAEVVAFAQRLVTYTDWVFTLGGVALLMTGGYGMAAKSAMPLFTARWLGWGQLMFVVSGVIWLCILVPTQIQQAREVRTFGTGSTAIPQSYWRLCRRWLFWGVAGTLPLLVALFLMIAKL